MLTSVLLASTALVALATARPEHHFGELDLQSRTASPLEKRSEPFHLVSRQNPAPLARRNLFGKRVEGETHNVSIFHINDVHSHLDQFRSAGTDCPGFNTTTNNYTTPCFGGYSRVAEYVRSARATKNNSLFLDAGDEFQGTTFFSYYYNKNGTITDDVIAETLNMLNFSAFTLGNHEFDNGDELLAKFLANLTFPTISTNVHSTYQPLAAQLHPYWIYPEHDLAIVALTTTTTPGIASPGNGTTFGNYTEVQSVTDALLRPYGKTQKSLAKRVVALTHIGYEEDVKLAQNSRGISLIVGGHSHTPLGLNSSGVNSTGDYPTIVTNLDGEEVFIVTAYRWGEVVGNIEVTYDNVTNKILSYTGAPVRLNTSYAQDPEIQAMVDTFRTPFEAYNKVVIGQTVNDLDQTACRAGECALGDAVTDSMLYSRTSIGADVQLALHNSGGIRATIEGPDVTQGGVLTAFPFGNSLVDLQFTGQELWDIFEGVYSGVNKNGATVTSLVQVSNGTLITFNAANPVGSRLISLTINGAFDLAATYTMTTLDFIATGGDFLIPNALSAAPPTLGSQGDVFSAFVTASSPLNYAVDAPWAGRIVPTTETVPLHASTFT